MSRPETSPGVHRLGDDTVFRVFASRADRVELCLFDERREVRRVPMSPERDGTWSTHLSGCPVGQQYGYRVHGPWDPARGLRHNPHKLLIDPYARALSGTFRWHRSLFDFQPEHEEFHYNDEDSAGHVPRSVVVADRDPLHWLRPAVPWSERIIYELNVRGYTMLHPELDETERGRLRGLANGQIVRHLRSLGITSVELMPVQAFVDEAFLAERGLRNLWGYNPLNFFTPAGRYAGDDPTGEFRDMVRSLHDAGLEVILDVVFNHTAEAGARGPTLSWRGLDHLAYYRVEPHDPSLCINDTGTGNTLNADHPRVQEMVLDALAWWHRDMGVDGFRFDLATVLGRKADGFDPDHPLLHAISRDPRLDTAQLIGEPWDPGPGGYQLGRLPHRWAEWNDRFRDAARAFWLRQPGATRELPLRMSGSPDLLGQRAPCASINFITAHDGFTLQDLVSYTHRHNEANGERNRDGHRHNLSCNHGVEGPTENPGIRAARRRHRLNLLATLLFSRGQPMLLAGDEFGNSQGGNNNAYAQDNETGWVQWPPGPSGGSLVDEISGLIRARGILLDAAEGDSQAEFEWQDATKESRPDLLLACLSNDRQEIIGVIAINGSEKACQISLPGPGSDWRVLYATDPACDAPRDQGFTAPAQSVCCLLKNPREGRD